MYKGIYRALKFLGLCGDIKGNGTPNIATPTSIVKQPTVIYAEPSWKERENEMETRATGHKGSISASITAAHSLSNEYAVLYAL